MMKYTALSDDITSEQQSTTILQPFKNPTAIKPSSVDYLGCAKLLLLYITELKVTLTIPVP